MSLLKGYVHVYTGDGKGKTTAAIGLGIRAVGAGHSVRMIQLMKGRRYSEIEVIEDIGNFHLTQHGRDEFVSKEDPEKIDMDLAREGFETAEKVISSGEHDMLILDEINVAVDFGLLSVQEVCDLVRSRPRKMEMVLTGRYAPREFIEMADLVTEMREIKHFYRNGVEARKGIEY